METGRRKDEQMGRRIHDMREKTEETETRRIQLGCGGEEEVLMEVGGDTRETRVRKTSYSGFSPAVVFSGVSRREHHRASCSSSPCVSSIRALRPAPGGSAPLRLRTEGLKVQRFVLERSLHVAEHPSILDPRAGGVGTEPGQKGGAVVLLAEPSLRHPGMRRPDRRPGGRRGAGPLIG